jgi:hypothetical protein
VKFFNNSKTFLENRIAFICFKNQEKITIIYTNGHSQQFSVPSALNVPRQKLIQNVVFSREALQQRIGSSGLEFELFYQQPMLNGKYSAANFRHQRIQENCYKSESVQQPYSVWSVILGKFPSAIQYK